MQEKGGKNEKEIMKEKWKKYRGKQKWTEQAAGAGGRAGAAGGGTLWDTLHTYFLTSKVGQ